MERLEAAKQLAGMGFRIFPIVPNTKVPAIEDFTGNATLDLAKIEKWWKERDFNIGIATTSYKDGALVVVDVDDKPTEGKFGSEEKKKLETLGFSFPPTLTQTSPSGGRHLIYAFPKPVKQGSNVLANGIDIRSRGGYILGPKSEIDGKFYKFEGPATIASAPDWIVQKCGLSAKGKELKAKKIEGVNTDEAIQRSIDYLKNHAPPAIQGQGGDQTTFKVACAVKDFGVEPKTAITLLAEHWNERCLPPWDFSSLRDKVGHAYQYGHSAVGASAPEADFQPITTPVDTAHPIDKLNESYAFVTTGGGHHILNETTSPNGNFMVDHLSEQAFHKRLASRSLQMGNRSQALTKAWMESPRRRSYRGICFRPGRETPEGFYNLWRGFTVESIEYKDASAESKRSVEMFLEHALKNICDNDQKLCDWLIGYFAHLIQKPYEKPPVALVFKGKKGTGKNALVERIGSLLGSHFMVTSDRRYLVGNFNGFLENNLMLVLDEAFWSGDKQAEGILKNLITGTMHVIEHKGKEPYTVDNCTRVVIIGNEEWLVPATQDERRFAVFKVGDGRRQDNGFFEQMRIGMENGGYRVLLKYLETYDLSKVDVRAAPQTEGLSEQKHASLNVIQQWWFSSLAEGTILGMGNGFAGGWPEEVDKDDVRDAFGRYFDLQNIRAKKPNDVHFGRGLLDCSPSIEPARRANGTTVIRTYRMPTIEAARKDWEKFIGHKVKWDLL